MNGLFLIFFALLNFVNCKLFNISEDEYRTWSGQPIDIRIMPYVTLIECAFSRGNEVLLRRCTGVFVHRQWILTAAHCLDILPDEVIITYGSTYVNSMYEEGANRENYKEIVLRGNDIEFIIYPDYLAPNNKALIYDIALIRLQKPIALSEIAQIATLEDNPWPRNEKGETILRKCLAVGYGLNKFRDHRLRGSVINIRYHWRNCECPKVSPYIICYTEGSVLCSGDSGGPLICNNRVVGVITQDRSCDNTQQTPIICAQPGLTSVYTYICPMMSWIKAYTKISGKDCMDPLDKPNRRSSASTKLTLNFFLIIIELLFFNF